MLFLDALASVYSESTSGSWDYPSDPPGGRFARPWCQVARMLVKYVDYYDFLYHGRAMDRPSPPATVSELRYPIDGERNLSLERGEEP